MKTKIEALAEFLNCETDEILESSYNSNTFEFGSQEYFVLTNEEADEKAKDYILDSIWAFNTEFIARHTTADLNERAIKSLRKMQEELCESVNGLIKSMINDLDYFVEDALSCDGRGHFMSSYDGAENEQDEYFIYRIN